MTLHGVVSPESPPAAKCAKLHARATSSIRCQGYLARKKTPTPLGEGSQLRLAKVAMGAMLRKMLRHVGDPRGLSRSPQLLLACREREFFIDSLLVRTHFIIVMIRWTGLAPWEFEFPFPGSLTFTFLSCLHATVV